ncbi:YihY/virulence factor BrkB family protein [Nesterenkonia sp.]|uniref:YihY/virulence factor BrkB family protein n=1 Tax=Nesterenkonia sp. TaxID=704201 RepID=UPI002601680B|nr:YihY/virulence factor BrkB family protein [Nesterenkonia sp.]
MDYYPSRLRPRSHAERTSTGGILDSARSTVEKLDDGQEVRAKVNPLQIETLKQQELQARMAYGRARRDGKSGLGLVGPLIGWGLARAQRTRVLRALNLFFFHYGTVMAAGAAYMMFFSVAAMLFASFSIAGLIIGGNEEYQQLIVSAVNTVLPGVLGSGENHIAAPADLFSTSGLGLGLAVSLALTVMTSLSWMHGLRSGIRSIWERPLMAENVVVVKARDLGLMLVLGLVIVSTAAAGLITRVFIDAVWEFMHWDPEGFWRAAVGHFTLGISFVLDMIVAVLLMRVASRLVMPISALWQSALIAGIGASLLRLGSTQLLQNFADTDNPVLAPFATVLGLFFYFYLFSLVYLMASAWGAVAAADAGERRR